MSGTGGESLIRAGRGPRGPGRRRRLLRRSLAALAVAAAVGSGASCRDARPDGSLEVLVPFLPESLDPFADSRLVARSIFTAVFEPLVEETAFGLRPAIAESWTNPEPDTWTFRIAEDSRFHDGSPVESRDVVDAALAARSSRGSLAGLANLKSISVASERIVRFRTARPAEDFLLSVSALFVPRKAGGTWLGTGPYRVVARTPGRLVLRRHPRPRHAVPLLEEVVFRSVSGPSEGLRLLRRARPLTAVLDPTPAVVEAARHDPRYRVVATESGGVTYLAVGFSAGAGPLADVRVRRALRLAIDFPAPVKEGTVAGGTPAGQLVPPGAFGFDPAHGAPRRDLEEARRLLALAGFPGGFDAVLDVNPNGKSAGEALAEQVAEAAIRLRVAVHSPEEFRERIDGRSPLYLYSWFVGQDAGQALQNAFHTKDAARGLGKLNRTGYSSPEVDLALAELAGTVRPEARLGRIRAVAALLDADLPWIPLFSAREARVLPADLDLPQRSDGLFVIAEARPASRRR